jgi:two-component system response regulator YesN
MNTRRLNTSMYLLKNTELNIKQIAEKLEFNNSNYFSRVFKKQFDMTPREFKEA